MMQAPELALTDLLDDEHDAAVRIRMKTIALARTSGWLDAQLARQDQILALAEGLSASFSTPAWTRQRTLLRQAVEAHFAVEESVLDPAIESLGLRAHVVVAGACRQRIRADLDALESVPWQDGEALVRRLRLELRAHFRQEESCSYRQLARQLSGADSDALTRRCAALLQRRPS